MCFILLKLITSLLMSDVFRLFSVVRLRQRSGCTCILLAGVPVVQAIDCFKCVSHSGDNLACEDPFHHNYTSEILHQPCLAGRKGREGLFPATACVKVTGTFGKDTP